jgi:hypothetical protein
MAVRKTGRTTDAKTQDSGRARKRGRDSILRQFSAIVGIVLIGIALLWFVWLLARQFNPVGISLKLPLPNIMPQQSSNAPADPLVAAGITLSSPAQGQEPLLSQQQALLLAAQIEAPIAARAKGVDSSYTLFSYQGNNAAGTSFHNVPVWLIHYSGVSAPPPDTAADPRASSASHDFYLFLDANSGRELLAIWL